MPLNDLEGHLCCLKSVYLPYLVKHSTNLLKNIASRGLSAVAELLVSQSIGTAIHVRFSSLANNPAYKNAKTHAGKVFVTRDLDPNILTLK